MAPRPCLGCGKLTTAGSRCGECGRGRQRNRDQVRGNRHARGYTNDWARRSKTVIDEERQCRDCGTTGTRDNPLTADHIIPKFLGGTDDRSNLCCRCRRHNSRKGH